MRLVTVTLWLLAGAALTAGVYWSFLITPESTGWSLAASALLAPHRGLPAGVTISGAAVGWRQGVSTSHIRTAVAGVPGIVPAALIVVAVLVAGRQRHGPGDALQRQHQGLVHRQLRLGRCGVVVHGRRLAGGVAEVGGGPGAGVVVAGEPSSRKGGDGLTNVSWITRALAPLTLATATLLFAALVAAPWIYLTPWRPDRPAPDVGRTGVHHCQVVGHRIADGDRGGVDHQTG